MKEVWLSQFLGSYLEKLIVVFPFHTYIYVVIPRKNRFVIECPYCCSADYKIGNIVFVADAHNLFQYFV